MNRTDHRIDQALGALIDGQAKLVGGIGRGHQRRLLYTPITLVGEHTPQYQGTQHDCQADEHLQGEPATVGAVQGFDPSSARVGVSAVYSLPAKGAACVREC
ncbi:hypothetical protein D3C77_620260 [compost metagenome]